MHQLTPQTAAQALSSGWRPTPAASPLPTPTAMATLWLRMTQIYAHRWTAPHGESPDAEGSSAETWAKGLAGLSGAHLAAGLRACITRADPWPPTLPEFRALCLSIPPMPAVRRELAGDGDRSGFAVLVWERLDSYAYRHADGRAAERILADAYAEAREHVMAGGALPPPRMALPAPEKPAPVPARPEVARAALAELRALYSAPAEEST